MRPPLTHCRTQLFWLLLSSSFLNGEGIPGALCHPLFPRQWHIPSEPSRHSCRPKQCGCHCLGWRGVQRITDRVAGRWGGGGVCVCVDQTENGCSPDKLKISQEEGL